MEEKATSVQTSTSGTSPRVIEPDDIALRQRFNFAQWDGLKHAVLKKEEELKEMVKAQDTLIQTIATKESTLTAVKQQFVSITNQNKALRVELQRIKDLIQMNQNRNHIEKLKRNRLKIFGEFDGDSKEEKTQNTEIETLKALNAEYKDRLQQMTLGKGSESAFIKEDEFSAQKLQPFRQQIFQQLHDDLVDILSEKYQDLEEDEEEEESDDVDVNVDNDNDDDNDQETKSKFELLMDRMAAEFLIDLLYICYHSMEDRKKRMCQITASQLQIEGNETQSAEDIASVMIHTQLQQQWNTYLNHKMENIYGIDVGDLQQEMEGIWKTMKLNKMWTMIGPMLMEKEQILKRYISKCCELSWIMILTKPKMTFYPKQFRDELSAYDVSAGHELCTGSNTRNDAKIVFFGFPAVAQGHFSMKSKTLLILKGNVFVHYDSDIIRYVMTDPGTS